MTKTTSLERAEIALTSSMEEPELAAPDPETPFRLLVVGDFSGSTGRAVRSASLGFDRLPVRVDRDNLGEVMDEMEVSLALLLAGKRGPETIFRFRSLDDFHPDRLFERTPAFGALRRIRAELEDPSTFAEAAATVRSWMGTTAPAPEEPDRESAPPSASEDIVADLLASAREKASRRPTDVDRFVRDIAAPHSHPAGDPDVPELVAAVDAMIASWIRNSLHHPAFRALEATWRGLAWLVDHVETDSQLQIWFLDVSKAELALDLRNADTVELSGWRKILVTQARETADAEPWAAVGALYAFDRTVEDVALLARLARVSREAGAPLVAEASPAVVGSAGFAEFPDPSDWRPGAPDEPSAQIWAALRELPEARWLGLAAPRFLLRLPYGEATDPTEGFEFEEMPEGARHEDYLWGGPALVCLELLGQAFAESGWRMRPGSVQEVGGLPLHVFAQDGEQQVKPCAEAVLSGRALEAMLEAGVMPLVSSYGRDVVRLARFQSIASAAAPLAGRWG